ncbi:MAG: efflux RND transporter periplasmic adaptor subunit [Syntrophomonas sp.]
MSPFKGSKRIYYFILAFLFLCLIVGCVWKAFSSSQTITTETISLVQTQVVKPNSEPVEYKYSGDVSARYESTLAFQVGGKIISRNVEVGSRVRAGDVLMQLDPRDAQQALANYAAQIASAQSQLKLAEDTLNRTEQLYKQGAASKAELDNIQNTYNTAAALLKQLNALYTASQNQLEYTSLRADRDGVVTSITAETGQVLVAMATAQTVVTLAKDDELEVEINVPENRITDLNNVQQIKASFWALPNISIDGKVREVSPEADPLARTFKVRITLLNPPPEIKLGMTSSITVVANSAIGDRMVTMPLSAVYQTGDTPSMWIVNNDTVSLRKIKIDSFESDRVIVSEGLNTGDIVVTAGVHKLHEGQKVRIENASQ